MRTYDLNQVQNISFTQRITSVPPGANRRLSDYPCILFTLSHTFDHRYSKSNNPDRSVFKCNSKVRFSLSNYGQWGKNLGEAIAVFLLAYFAAFMETYTIEEVSLPFSELHSILFCSVPTLHLRGSKTNVHHRLLILCNLFLRFISDLLSIG